MSTGKAPLEKSNEAPSPPTADSVLSTRLPLSDYVCRSPHCRTPDVPLADFESGIMEPILIRLALSYCHEAVDDVKSSLLQREFADARLLERLILRFCCEGDSFATVVRKLGSVEVRKKLDQAVDDIFDEEMRAQEGKPSLSSLLFESLQYLLNAGFNLIEQTVQIARSKGDRATAFCLHHVQQNRTMLEAIVKQKRPREDRKFVTCNVSSLWLEIRAGMLSGRIAGDGWTLEERSESDLISEFAEGFDRAGECHSRVSDRIDHCWTRAIELVGAGPPLSDFLQVYCDSSTPFLDSTLLQQLSYDVKRMDLCRCSACIPVPLPPFTTASLSPSEPCPTTNPMRSSALHTPTSSINLPSPPDPFHALTERHPLHQLGLIDQPHCCPPDICSGQPPIESNYPLVDKALMSLFGYWFKAVMLRGIVTENLHAALGCCVAEMVGSLEVGTADRRRMVLESLPGVLIRESQRVEREEKFLVKGLSAALWWTTSSLLGIREDRQPCLCDLTRSYPQLLEAVNVAKSRFDYECNPATLSGATESSLLHLQQRLYDDPDAQRSWRTPGWEDLVQDFAEFVNEPLATLVQSSSDRLAGFDRSFTIIKLLGSARILQEINSTGREPEQMPGERVQISCTAANAVLHHCQIHPSKTLSVHFGRIMRNMVDKQTDVPKFSRNDSLGFYAAACTIDPTDYLARWSQAISDCTMAIHYGPPSFKAYYRRGYALARLDMWDKAVLDFERALALEPRDVFLQERLQLARRKKW